MVQDQLVEYITSQLKAGTAAETLKATLVAAGWQAADVEDTLKKVQPAPAGGVGPQPMASGIGGVVSAAGPASMGPAKVAPQTIRVSDLVSASTPDKSSAVVAASASAMKAADSRAEATKKFLTPNVAPGATSYQAPAMGRAVVSSSPASGTGRGSRGALTTELVLGILMVVFGAVAVYFIFANRNLVDQVSSLTSQSAGVTSQVSALQNQLDASTTALMAEVTSATDENQALALNLAFYAVPAGTQATPASTTALTGYVTGGGRLPYVIVTPYGVKVTVANSKDAKVIAAMQPLVGSTTTIPFGGTYTPGVASITLTMINGASLITPPAMPVTATSSATSTGATTTAAAPMIPATSTPSGQ